MKHHAALIARSRRGPPAAVARPHLPDAPGLDGFDPPALPLAGRDVRSFAVYDAHAAFALADELEFLVPRAVEPNPFFAPRFLVPAMPRLEDRAIRLLVGRDQDERRSRLRFFLPFTLDAVGWRRRATVRAWTHPFGPLGTPPLDRDDPEGTVASLFDAFRDPALRLPDILVLPDLHLDGPTAGFLRAAAAARGLAFAVADRRERAAHRPGLAPVRARHRREAARLRRRLEETGRLALHEAREPAAVREATETFLLLESQGWKGRARSSLLHDRYRSAFAREALNGLAEQDRVRLFTLTLDGEAVASLAALVVDGEAVLWKTAYDERRRRAGPGALVALMAADALRADPRIRVVDSCAVPDHAVMNRVLTGRIAVGTLVVALRPEAGAAVEEVARDLEARRRRLNRRRRILGGVRGFLRL